jgi:hypothetical protein
MNKYMRFVKYGLAAGAVVLAMSGMARAAIVQDTCNTASVTTSTACKTVSGQGNDSVSIMNAGLGLFGNTDWLLADKSDSAPSIAGMTLNFTGADQKQGTWSVSNFGGYSKAVLVVKAGSAAWIAYLLDLTQLSGTWSTAGLLNNGGQRPNMSHLSLYVADLNTNITSPIPLPGPALLLLGAIGALTALRRRKA